MALVLLVSLHGPAHAAPKLRLVLIPPADAKLVGLFGPARDELSRTERCRVVPLQALIPLMRQADVRADVRGRAMPLVEEGRRALVALDHARARTKFTKALEVLQQSFIDHYDPRAEAQVHLLLGIVSLREARPELALQEFVKVHHLDPGFKLDAHYSPQVRATFRESSRNLPPSPVPSTGDLGRIVDLAKARLALVFSVHQAGERNLIQGSLFLKRTAAYTKVESRLINPADANSARDQAHALGARLRRLVESELPAPARPAKVRTKNKQPQSQPYLLPPPTSTPPTPWYLKWYTLLAAGIAVAGTLAIVLPLTLQQEHVRLTVTLPP